MREDNTYLYREMPVRRAIFTLAIPTVISQLITVLYNMADTFFIGQMNDPNQVAAATVATPLFVMLTGIANLFGIGGSSLISRYLGQGKRNRAQNCAVFSIWGAGTVAIIYGIAVMIFRPQILPLFGTTNDTYTLCYGYLFWTVTVGGLPTVLSAAMAHLIRSEGYSRQASLGIAMGGILNMLLDPVFIFAFHLEIKGAAIATMLSNLFAMGYYFLFLFRIRHNTVISPNPKYFTLRHNIPFETAAVGFPSFMMTLMGTASNVVLNKLVSSYSSETIAGMGIAKKIDTLAFAIATGMTQGVLSLIGYNYSSGSRKRMEEVIKKTFAYTLFFAACGSVFLFVGAVPISRFFIDNADTVAYGQYFLRVICLTCPTISVTFIIITTFQATGRKIQPMILSLLRKGMCDVPFMFLLKYFWGAYGIAWATPISDLISMSVAICLFIPFMKKMHREGLQ
ncbi:MAG: MATE family efflux transporter [Lachnospiraceae bacterium]|nr:MATE family efflux transporter [Lachnospiraceae bacterium]